MNKPSGDVPYLADTAQDEGLAGIITVGTDTEVHLARVGILLEGLSDTENGIGRAYSKGGRKKRRQR
jgi:hypothetical protein